MPALRNLFESFVLPNDGVDDRYNNAVSLLAGIDPLLAFSLRSKNILPKVFASLRNFAIGTGADLKEFESVEAAEPFTLAEGVTDLRFEYFGAENDTAKPAWSSKRFPPAKTRHTKEDGNGNSHVGSGPRAW